MLKQEALNSIPDYMPTIASVAEDKILLSELSKTLQMICADLNATYKIAGDGLIPIISIGQFARYHLALRIIEKAKGAGL